VANILTPYQRAFSDWLSKYKFKTFATFTTKQPLTLPGARRMAGNFGHYIQAGKEADMFWAAEPFDTREGYHFHALLNTTISNPELKHYWETEKRFGYGSFLEIHRKLGKENQIECYCSKYITKNLADFDLYSAPLLPISMPAGSTGLPDKPDYISPYQL